MEYKYAIPGLTIYLIVMYICYINNINSLNVLSVISFIGMIISYLPMFYHESKRDEQNAKECAEYDVEHNQIRRR